MQLVLSASESSLLVGGMVIRLASRVSHNAAFTILVFVDEIIG